MPSVELLARLRDLVRRDRGLTAELLANIGEVEVRRLHLEAACPSMFRYCTDILGMSGAQSYKRIGAARLARRFPQVLPMIKSGAVHLSTLCLLEPHLTADNAGILLPLVAGMSKREVEKLLAARFPSPAVPDRVRKLPWRGRPDTGWNEHDPRHSSQRKAHSAASQPVEAAPNLPFVSPPSSGQQHPRRDETGGEQVNASGLCESALLLSRPPRRPSVSPLFAEQYRVQLTASARLVDKIRTAQELLRHQVPDGDLATILERALDALLPALRKQRFAEVARPREGRRAGKTVATKTRRSPSSNNKSTLRDLGASQAAGTHTRARTTDNGDSRSEGRRSAAGSPRTNCAASRFSKADPSITTAPGRSRTSRSRHIPSAVKRQVARRDEYQCTFTDGTGRQCSERGMLEFHHIRPFGKGGRHDVENITLLCRGHNHLASVQEYGVRASAFAKTTGREAEEELPPGEVEAPLPHCCL